MSLGSYPVKLLKSLKASRWIGNTDSGMIDEAFGVAAGYNFFVFEAMLVPFEVVACNLIIHFWSDAVPAGGIIAIIIVLYGYNPLVT